MSFDTSECLFTNPLVALSGTNWVYIVAAIGQQIVPRARSL
jgi:hypothetical protein